MNNVRNMLSSLTPPRERSANPLDIPWAQPSPETVGDELYVTTIDKLRELGVAELVSLPQLVVVGDQSSGKSSVLESLTDFAFPRAPGLCTRYVTQITCRRDPVAGVVISIIPGPGSSDAKVEELGWFKRSLAVDDLDLAEVFYEANEVMGIRTDEEGDEEGDEDPTLATFSEDILKIEISGPDRQHLTVIDVPGIFRNNTDNQTTADDINLVNKMVRKYIEDDRTIILAVVPCNQDVATQEILRLAREVDPEGQRTLGVLTKPDLAPEAAMQRKILDLVEGRKHSLRLGYFVVKNRGADDHDNSTLQNRRRLEAAFFNRQPWSGLKETGRVGTPALLAALTNLLRTLTKKEFRDVSSEVEKHLYTRRKAIDSLGPGRSDSASQRRFLGKISSEFQDVARCAREGQYGQNIFKGRPQMRLITLIRRINEEFNLILSELGHSRNFLRPEEPSKRRAVLPGKDHVEVDFSQHPDLFDILEKADFDPNTPTEKDSLMDHITATFNDCRGPEIGTINPAILGIVFSEQSKHWEALVLRHTSRAIVLVHQFFTQTLSVLCPDKDVRERIWTHLLLDDVLAAYKRAMEHARFLVKVERDGNPVTVNHDLAKKLRECRIQRLGTALERANSPSQQLEQFPGDMIISQRSLATVTDDRTETYLEIHDNLETYYNIALARFVDSVCKQVVFYFLLESREGPLSVFSPDQVMGLSDDQLQQIASEDSVTRDKREKLGREVEKLQEAVKVLRLAA